MAVTGENRGWINNIVIKPQYKIKWQNEKEASIE
jgi:hypothetical protein